MDDQSYSCVFTFDDDITEAKVNFYDKLKKKAWIKIIESNKTFAYFVSPFTYDSKTLKKQIDIMLKKFRQKTDNAKSITKSFKSLFESHVGQLKFHMEFINRKVNHKCHIILPKTDDTKLFLKYLFLTSDSLWNDGRIEEEPLLNYFIQLIKPKTGVVMYSSLKGMNNIFSDKRLVADISCLPPCSDFLLETE